MAPWEDVIPQRPTERSNDQGASKQVSSAQIGIVEGTHTVETLFPEKIGRTSPVEPEVVGLPKPSAELQSKDAEKELAAAETRDKVEAASEPSSLVSGKSPEIPVEAQLINPTIVIAPDTAVTGTPAKANLQSREKLARGLPRGTTKKTRTAGPGMVQHLPIDEASGPIRESFSSLSGLLSRIVRLAFEDCIRRGEKVTGPLSSEFVARGVESTVASVKKSIQRLDQRRILIRTEYKDGRGGWSRYQLHSQIYQELLMTQVQSGQAKVETKLRQLPASGNESNSELPFSAPSGSWTDEWDQVDVSSLASLGFTKTHIRQIASDRKLSPKEVQDSILFYSFDLKVNGKSEQIKGSPINFLMGILRRGAPYTPPENYESPEAAARRTYLTYLQRENAMLQEQQAQLQLLEFEKWRSKTSKSDLLRLLPPHAQNPGRVMDTALKGYFDEHVWPTVSGFGNAAELGDREKIRTQIDQSLSL